MNRMFNKPLLGGFHEKVAGAYLLPPTTKPKKKKKVQPDEQLEELDKAAAALATAVVLEKQAELHRRVQSGDLGGGWDPNNQLNQVQ